MLFDKLARGGGQPLGIAAAQRHIRAFGKQHACGRKPDTGATAGHYRDASRETEIHSQLRT